MADNKKSWNNLSFVGKDIGSDQLPLIVELGLKTNVR
jgi:hypothetical protein